MRLGIGSYTYVWAVGVPGYAAPDAPLTAWDLLEKATALGVHVVQIADNLPLHCLEADKLDALRCRADELAISLEVGTAGINARTLERYLSIAQRVGSPILRTTIDGGEERPSPQEVVARLAPLMPGFEQAGVTLALENHDRFTSATLLALLKRIGSPQLGICLDTANSLGCMEGIGQVVEILGSHVVNLHLKDVGVFRPPHNKGFLVEGRPAGQGQVDFPALLHRLGALGVDPNAIVELWPPPEATPADAIAREDEWARESVRYLRTLIAD